MFKLKACSVRLALETSIFERSATETLQVKYRAAYLVHGVFYLSATYTLRPGMDLAQERAKGQNELCQRWIPLSRVPARHARRAPTPGQLHPRCVGLYKLQTPRYTQRFWPHPANQVRRARCSEVPRVSRGRTEQAQLYGARSAEIACATPART